MNDKKVINAWAIFDWANSAYALVIATAIFPIYFIAVSPDVINVFGTEISDSSLYSFSISLAYLLIALIAPILGGIADAGSKRKFFMRAFTLIGSVACATLFLFSDASMVWLGTAAFIIATVGFAGSLIFYDALLPDIASSDMYDQVSAKGYAFGYIGSVLLLIFILYMSQSPEVFGFQSESDLPYRLGFLLVGVWWYGFAQYSFKHLPKDKEERLKRGLIRSGYREVKKVWAEIQSKKDVKWFLISFFFYSAGVQTVIYLATIFAEKELRFETSELIITVLILQLVAIVGAYIFAHYSTRAGSSKAIIVMILIWIGICIGAYFVQTKAVFFMLAFAVGLVLGGLQSSSRASYTKLIHGEEELNSYFSIYDLLFYLSIVFGTFSFGLIESLTHNLRYSVLILSLYFIIALIIFTRVRFPPTST